MKASTVISALVGFAAGAQVALISGGSTNSERQLPPNLPTFILPDSSGQTSPGTTAIQIGFLNSLNYEFVGANPTAAAEIFNYLPEALSQAANIDANSISIEKLIPYDTRASLGYITTIAKLRYPSKLVQALKIDIANSKSPLYKLSDATLRDLVAQINSSVDLLGNN